MLLTQLSGPDAEVLTVIPAKAGIQALQSSETRDWTPAFVGVTSFRSHATPGLLQRVRTSSLRIRPPVALSLGYLALPYFAFLLGWLHWYISIPLVILLVFSLTLPARLGKRSSDQVAASASESVMTMSGFLTIVLLASGVVVLSGVGGFGFQDSDWFKHNAILYELINQPWPVFVETPQGALPLVYYTAYYLPAALVGKACGWHWAQALLFVWTQAGIILALVCLCAFVPRFPPAVVSIFLVFSGLDAVGLAILGGPFDSHIEWWAGHWQYSSNLTLLFWVPSMAISGWLLTGLLIYEFLSSDSRSRILLVFGLSTLWSPFISVGLLPYLAADFLSSHGSIRNRLARYISVPNLCGLFLIAVSGTYFGAKFCELPLEEGDVFDLIFFSTRTSEPALHIFLKLILFCLLEFGIYSFLIIKSINKRGRRIKMLFAVTITVLACLPLFQYGHYNDLAMRASIPALFVLCILVLQTIFNKSTSRPIRALLLGSLAVGMVTPALEVARHVDRFSEPAKITEGKDLRSVQEEVHKHFPLMAQYVGCQDTFFFRCLTRSAEPAKAP